MFDLQWRLCLDRRGQESQSQEKQAVINDRGLGYTPRSGLMGSYVLRPRHRCPSHPQPLPKAVEPEIGLTMETVTLPFALFVDCVL